MDVSTSDLRLFDALKDVSFTEFITLKLIKFLYVISASSASRSAC